MRSALAALENAGAVIRATSELYRTPAYPAGSGPDFVNAAVAIEADWTPEVALEKLHGIEADFGRARTVRWGPRVLDLDLIGAGDLIRPTRAIVQQWIDLPPELQTARTPDELLLPHPRLQDRAFVLVPLADVAPHWRHPVLGKTVAELLDALPAQARREVVKIA